MTLLEDLRARFAKARERREELTAQIHEAQETAEQRQHIELQIEAEELAAKVPALMEELRGLLADLPMTYFEFEQVARQELTPAVLDEPARRLVEQSMLLRSIYDRNGARDYSTANGMRLGPIPGRRAPGDLYDPLAQAEDARRRGNKTAEYQYRRMAEEREQEAARARRTLYAPEWLPRLVGSGFHGLNRAEAITKAWNEVENG